MIDKERQKRLVRSDHSADDKVTLADVVSHMTNSRVWTRSPSVNDNGSVTATRAFRVQFKAAISDWLQLFE
jgi:hypothetical protein